MGTGFLILIGTFLVVGILHFISMKTMNLSDAKKTRYRKLFWYFYGVIFMVGGGVNLIEKGAFHWSFALQFILGLGITVLNFFGRIETKINQT